MSKRWRHVRGDEGVSLVLALVFMVIVGFFVTVALEKNQSTTLVGGAVRDRTQLQYTLDGAVDRTLQSLRDEMLGGSPTTCTSPTSPDGTGSLTLNGHTASSSCRTLGGRAALAGEAASRNFALVTTSAADGALKTQSGVAQDLQVAGSVYLHGKVVNNNLDKDVELTTGDLVSPASTSCQNDLDALTDLRLIGTGQLRSCTEQTLAQALPTVSLPTAPTTDLSPLLGAGVQFVSGSSKCTVYYPGLYSAPPALANDSKNYFVSGLYYFRFAGAWIVDDANVQITGGQREAGSNDSAAPTNDCSAMGMDDSIAMGHPAVATLTTVVNPYRFAHGNTWVFGSSARLDVRKGSFTLFSPPAGGSTVAVSFVGASSYTHGSYTPQPVGTATLTGGGNQSSMRVNGKVFAPNSYVEIFSTNATVAAATGGVVANSILLKASASGSDALVISAASGPGTPPPPFRTVLVETTDASASSSAKNRTVATISNFPPHTVGVRSWRTD